MIEGSSAALAIWGLATAFTVLWRLWTVRRMIGRRQAVLLIGAASVAAGLGVHQSYVWYAWEMNLWGGAVQIVPVAVVYRALWGAGLLLLAGSTTWEKCGHRGWLSLVALGSGAWLVAWAV